MNEIARMRLHQQRLMAEKFTSVVEAVSYLGVVQSQEYAWAKWALGQRISGLMDDAVEEAFTAGEILRTHVLRPTWHFVTPADIRWMLKLTAPRIKRQFASYYRQEGMEGDIFPRSQTAIVKALEGGKQLARPELAAAIEAVGIKTDGLRFSFLMTEAELDGLVCSGARQGNHSTYMLLDERVPDTNLLERDAALAELARRYFVSHGPATIKDYSWWSGLSLTESRAGLEMVKSELQQMEVDGQTYWFADAPPAAELAKPIVHLLPPYDEYTVAYKDRTAFLDPADFARARNGIFSAVITVNGRIIGLWKRVAKKDLNIVEAELFAPLDEPTAQALSAAVESYGRFLGLPLSLVLS